MLCGRRRRRRRIRKHRLPRTGIADMTLRMDAIRVSKVSSAKGRISHVSLTSVFQVDNVILDDAGKRYEGTLHLTAHHLIFTGDDVEEVWVSILPFVKRNHTVNSATPRLPIPSSTSFIDYLRRCKEYRHCRLELESLIISSLGFDGTKTPRTSFAPSKS